jgi:hypothetical protein
MPLYKLSSDFEFRFFLDLPFYVAAVYGTSCVIIIITYLFLDDLGLMCPDDIEEYRSFDGEEDRDVFNSSLPKENHMAGQLDEFINSLNVNDEEDSHTGQSSTAVASTSSKYIIFAVILFPFQKSKFSQYGRSRR